MKNSELLTLSDMDAQTLFFESVHCTGWYPLMILTVSETFEQARQEYGYHPVLWDLLTNACADVAASGGEDGDRLAQARALAIRNAVQMANQAGIILHSRAADPAEFADDGDGTP